MLSSQYNIIPRVKHTNISRVRHTKTQVHNNNSAEASQEDTKNLQYILNGKLLAEDIANLMSELLKIYLLNKNAIKLTISDLETREKFSAFLKKSNIQFPCDIDNAQGFLLTLLNKLISLKKSCNNNPQQNFYTYVDSIINFANKNGKNYSNIIRCIKEFAKKIERRADKFEIIDSDLDNNNYCYRNYAETKALVDILAKDLSALSKLKPSNSSEFIKASKNFNNIFFLFTKNTNDSDKIKPLLTIYKSFFVSVKSSEEKIPLKDFLNQLNSILKNFLKKNRNSKEQNLYNFFHSQIVSFINEHKANLGKAEFHIVLQMSENLKLENMTFQLPNIKYIADGNFTKQKLNVLLPLNEQTPSTTSLLTIIETINQECHEKPKENYFYKVVNLFKLIIEYNLCHEYQALIKQFLSDYKENAEKIIEMPDYSLSTNNSLFEAFIYQLSTQPSPFNNNNSMSRKQTGPLAYSEETPLPPSPSLSPTNSLKGSPKKQYQQDHSSFGKKSENSNKEEVTASPEAEVSLSPKTITNKLCQLQNSEHEIKTELNETIDEQLSYLDASFSFTKLYRYNLENLLKRLSDLISEDNELEYIQKLKEKINELITAEEITLDKFRQCFTVPENLKESSLAKFLLNFKLIYQTGQSKQQSAEDDNSGLILLQESIDYYYELRNESIEQDFKQRIANNPKLLTALSRMINAPNARFFTQVEKNKPIVKEIKAAKMKSFLENCEKKAAKYIFLIELLKHQLANNGSVQSFNSPYKDKLPWEKLEPLLKSKPNFNRGFHITALNCLNEEFESFNKKYQKIQSQYIQYENSLTQENQTSSLNNTI